MTVFLRLLNDKDKQSALHSAVKFGGSCVFDVEPSSFSQIPGSPFAYWVSESIRETFKRVQPFESNGRTLKQGLATADDFRFLRTWWEVVESQKGIISERKWYPFAKGGKFSPFYAELPLVINWERNGREIHAFERSVIRNPIFYFRPGITWPLRSNKGLTFRAFPAGCIFGHKGPAVFVEHDEVSHLLAVLALTNSDAFATLVSLHMAFGSYEVGVIQRSPMPILTVEQTRQLALAGRQAWSLKRTLDTVTETSHAFVLPRAVLEKHGFDSAGIKQFLEQVHADIDKISFEVFGFSAANPNFVKPELELNEEVDPDEEDDDKNGDELDSLSVDALLSWAAGVAFGRFDWRLATGERERPAEPDPFQALPAKAPAMLPDGAKPFHQHSGILVDDEGNEHNLRHLIEEVLARINMPIPDDVAGWLRRRFFSFHLQHYSVSRRKAPIYWPLATASGSYTLWIYYPSINSQTLYTAVNDFIEPKLRSLQHESAVLGNRDRSREDEKQLEALQVLEQELIEFRSALLKLAPNYKPNPDDGVQICAAPLWSLFRDKTWRKLLKDTWNKLEKGDYDWAHLAMNYCPDRIRNKCKSDQSFAIAQGLEQLYIESQSAAQKSPVKKVRRES